MMHARSTTAGSDAGERRAMLFDGEEVDFSGPGGARMDATRQFQQCTLISPPYMAGAPPHCRCRTIRRWSKLHHRASTTLFLHTYTEALLSDRQIRSASALKFDRSRAEGEIACPWLCAFCRARLLLRGWSMIAKSNARCTACLPGFTSAAACTSTWAYRFDYIRHEKHS